MVDIDEQIAWENEKAELRRLWEENRKAEAERQAQQEKRARLGSYLRRREEAWTEHTGTPPTAGMRRAWTEEYVNSTIIDEDVDLELRRARAASEDVW